MGATVCTDYCFFLYFSKFWNAITENAGIALVAQQNNRFTVPTWHQNAGRFSEQFYPFEQSKSLVLTDKRSTNKQLYTNLPGKNFISDLLALWPMITMYEICGLRFLSKTTVLAGKFLKRKRRKKKRKKIGL